MEDMEKQRRAQASQHQKNLEDLKYDSDGEVRDEDDDDDSDGDGGPSNLHPSAAAAASEETKEAPSLLS